MSLLSPYQQAILGQLGISQWQLREQASVDAENTKHIVAQESSAEPASAKAIASPIRENLLQRPGTFINDVKCFLPHDPNLKWHENHQFELKDNALHTPSLASLKDSVELKKQLWQVLQTWQG